MRNEPTEVWLGVEGKRCAFVYAGVPGTNVLIGRHHLYADVPVRPAVLDDACVISRVAAEIDPRRRVLKRVGESRLTLILKDGASRQMSRGGECDRLEQIREVEFGLPGYSVTWQVGLSERSICLIEPGDRITHVIPWSGQLEDVRRHWGAMFLARDAAGWHVDRLSEAKVITPQTALQLAHIYHP